MPDNLKTILIADDHALFRDGLAGLISRWDEYRLIGEVENGQQALDFCRQVRPDIILMDINMPVMGGIEATKRIIKEFPLVSILMLTMAIEKKSIYDAIKAGAQGYILKDIRAQELKSSLNRVLHGESVLSGMVAKIVLSDFKHNRLTYSGRQFDENGLEILTEREMEIIQLVVEGLSNIEIASQLYLSDQTIKKALGDVMQKLQLNNRVQVTAYALRNGLAK